jgi:hypothetical protein
MLLPTDTTLYIPPDFVTPDYLLVTAFEVSKPVHVSRDPIRENSTTKMI